MYSMVHCRSLYVSDVIEMLVVWRHNKPKTKKLVVPSSQALLGFLITASPSVCVPTVLDTLVVWIQKPEEKKERKKKAVVV